MPGLFLMSGKCCGCDEHCDDGQICLTVTECCSPFGAISGVSVTVTKHSDHSSIGSCSTDSLGKCCVTVPGNDDYDIGLSKNGCTGGSILNVHVPCGTTVNESACLYCTPHTSCLVFDVRGCGGQSLPGATVEISGPKEGTCVTGDDGKCTICVDLTGTYSYTITADRFTTITGTIVLSSLCGSGPTGIYAPMSPATGYQCCFTPCFPYAQALDLNLSDPAGTISFSGCTVGLCHAVMMDHAADIGFTVPNNCVSCPTCPPPGLACQQPPTWTTTDVVVYYALDLSMVGNLCVQSIPGAFLGYDDSCTFCAINHCKGWRFSTAYWNHVSPCNVSGVFHMGYIYTGYTINSCVPFSITINFSGVGWWDCPSVASCSDSACTSMGQTGTPYTTSVTISE